MARYSSENDNAQPGSSPCPPLLGRCRGDAAPYANPRQPHLPLVASVEIPGELGSSKVQVFGLPGACDRAGVVLRFTVTSDETDHDLVPHAELRADGCDLHLVTTFEAANILEALASALRITAERAQAQKSAELQRHAVVAATRGA